MSMGFYVWESCPKYQDWVETSHHVPRSRQLFHWSFQCTKRAQNSRWQSFWVLTIFVRSFVFIGALRFIRHTFLLIICFSFIDFLVFSSFVLFELIYLSFIIALICTFCLHCPLCCLFHADLIRFDVAFRVFVPVIAVFFLIAKLFATLLLTQHFRARLFPTFSLTFWIRLIGFAYKYFVTFLFPQFTLEVYSFLLQ